MFTPPSPLDQTRPTHPSLSFFFPTPFPFVPAFPAAFPSVQPPQPNPSFHRKEEEKNMSALAVQSPNVQRTSAQKAKVSQQYQKKSHLEHIKERPDTYIGSCESRSEVSFFFGLCIRVSCLQACSQTVFVVPPNRVVGRVQLRHVVRRRSCSSVARSPCVPSFTLPVETFPLFFIFFAFAFNNDLLLLSSSL